KRMQNVSAAQQERLEQRLSSVRRKMDQAYEDKLNGTIPEDFWNRKMEEWRSEEQQVRMALDGLKESKNSDRLLDATRILELANKASFLYVTQNPTEQAKLLKLVLLNCAVDDVSVYPTYRKPFDLIFERAREKELVGERGFEPP